MEKLLWWLSWSLSVFLDFYRLYSQFWSCRSSVRKEERSFRRWVLSRARLLTQSTPWFPLWSYLSASFTACNSLLFLTPLCCDAWKACGDHKGCGVPSARPWQGSRRCRCRLCCTCCKVTAEGNAAQRSSPSQRLDSCHGGCCPPLIKSYQAAEA